MLEKQKQKEKQNNGDWGRKGVNMLSITLNWVYFLSYVGTSKWEGLVDRFIGLGVRWNISFGDILVGIFVKIFLNCGVLCNKIISQWVQIPIIFI